ncbi:MAG: GFA family protein [Hyphomicrobiales bacterium]|nr:GFA family protein [Hyphomicrobiales bacterium]MDE2017528.1 GFA family protein [Hyphomicrobiales bacterium]
MAEKTYAGSCQCDRVKFEATLDLDRTVTCNCSRCQRLGWVMAFTPQAKFALTAGEGATTEFLFNKERIRHRFCPVCGIETFAYAKSPDGADVVAVNVNCLEGVDPRALTSKHVDGKSI